jgi:hypothetical protein
MHLTSAVGNIFLSKQQKKNAGKVRAGQHVKLWDDTRYLEGRLSVYQYFN